MRSGKKSKRIKKNCVFHYVCLVGGWKSRRIEIIYVFLYLVEKKNEMKEIVVLRN